MSTMTRMRPWMAQPTLECPRLRQFILLFSKALRELGPCSAFGSVALVGVREKLAGMFPGSTLPELLVRLGKSIPFDGCWVHTI